MLQESQFEKQSNIVETNVLRICGGLVERINKIIKKLSFFITQRTTSLLGRAQRQNLRMKIKAHFARTTKKWIPMIKRLLLQQFSDLLRDKANLKKQLYIAKIQKTNQEKIELIKKKQRGLIKMKAIRMRVDDYLEKKKTMQKKSQKLWNYAKFLKNKVGQIQKFTQDCEKGDFDSKHDEYFINQTMLKDNKQSKEIELVMKKFKDSLKV